MRRNMPSIPCCLSVALIFLLAAGCEQSSPTRDVPDPPNVASKAQAIQGGANDGPAHPYAVGVCTGAKGDCSGLCSGVLILPNVVATARHCVNEVPLQIDCTANPPVVFGADKGTNWVTTSANMHQTTDGWHHVDHAVVPSDDKFCGNDIALLVLSDVIPASEARPVIPSVQFGMGDLSRYAHSFTAIGFGAGSPKGADVGTRRIRQNIDVTCIPNDGSIPCPPASLIGDKEFLGGGGLCEGDSGSGAFETQSFLKGAPVAFGVFSSLQASSDGTTCANSIYARFDQWRDLIVQAAQTASANWTLYPKPIPDWTLVVSSLPDAGTPDTGPKKPSNLENGVACGDDSECKSKVCADTGAGKTCTTSCDDADPAACTEGMVCRGGVCVQDLGEPAAPATTDSNSGCAVGPAGERDVGWGSLGVSAAVGLFAGFRRRSSRKRSPAPREDSA
jgi:hypothetical protein